MRFGVRPEDVGIALTPARDWDEARVTVVEPVGSETLITLEWRGQRLTARVAPDLAVIPGRTVWIRFPPDRVLVFDTEGPGVAR